MVGGHCHSLALQQISASLFGHGSPTPDDLFHGQRPDLSALHPFVCLAYVHLQKDQCPALGSHAMQCVHVGYLTCYKGWRFWDLNTHKDIISDGIVFCELVFPFCKPSLSCFGSSSDSDPPPAHTLILPSPPVYQLPPLILPDVPPPMPATPPPWAPPVDLLEWPHTPPVVKSLTSNFQHHPVLENPFPQKQPTRACTPGALAKANTITMPADDIAVPLVDAVEYACFTSVALELGLLWRH